MNTTLVALVILLIVGVGVYIGISNLVTQYAFEPSGGLASGVACAPSVAEARAGQAVRFSASGLPAGTVFHWATDEGAATVVSGGLQVMYPTPGQKTAYLFYAAADRWYRTSCSVLVR